MLGTLSVSCLPLVMMALWNMIQFQKALRAEKKLPIINLVSNTEQSISMYLDERKSTLQFMLQDNTFEELSEPERLATIMHNLNNAIGGLVDMGVIDSSGAQINYVGPHDLLGKNYQNEHWFGEVSLRGVYISEVFLGYRSFPHIVIAAKHDMENGDFFVLRMTIDTKKFNDIIADFRVRSSNDIFLVNSKGVIQTESQSFGDVLEQFPIDLPRATNQVEIFDMEEERNIIVGQSKIENTPFTLIVIKEPRGLADGRNTFLSELIGFLAISIVVITVMILRVVTVMVGRIEEADRRRVMYLHKAEHTNKLASIGRLSAGVAHEINNPLAIINEKAGLLKDFFGAAPDSKDKELVLKTADSILRSVERCSTITYRLLGFARHIDVREEAISPRTLINEVLGFLGKEAEYRNIEISLRSEDDIPDIVSDRGQLEQVFLNIINNAMAAVHKGGHIDVEIKRAKKDHVSIAIADDGPGIPPEHLDNIFEPFFTTRGRDGTGLGLSITYGIVKKLKGTIEVESKVDKGTKFIVTLPVRKP